MSRTPPYPPTRKVDQIDSYHGTLVSDPFRWLENSDSQETKEWISAQNKVTANFLEGISRRQGIKKRFTELWDYDRHLLPAKYGGLYFFEKMRGLQNQWVLYVSSTLEDSGKVLVDPNTLGDTVSLRTYAVSPDGKLVAYGLSQAGSDWTVWKIRDVATCRDLPEQLEWIKFSDAAWNADSSGFYYSRFDAPRSQNALEEVNYFQKLYYHRIGTQQSEDLLIYERRDQKEWGFDSIVTEDGQFLIIGVSQGTDPRKRIFYKTLSLGSTDVVPLISELEANYRFLGNDGVKFYFYTDLEAPRGRVIVVDLEHPTRSNWKTVIPESTNSLEGISLVGNNFVAMYLIDACAEVQVFSIEGRYLRTVPLPDIGMATGFQGKRTSSETFFQFTNFTTPANVIRYDVESGEISVQFQSALRFNPADFETRQVFYKSKDGTRIPMFISHRKNLVLDGKNPTLLYGYGGFNISLTPIFSVKTLAWMELGGVYAQPSLRGGSEYGEEWHLAGTKAKKQNVFDDFIAAAEWLIEKKYTSSRHLGIHGRSNGGLLIGACLTQRPELFGAAVPVVGCLDMLRFHTFTIGWAWVTDFGSPDDPEDFKALRAYSPLHNLKKGTHYPPTLIMTGDHDDRVVPAHSFKFAAALQDAQGGTSPVLIRVAVDAGHGMGTPSAMLISEFSDEVSFLYETLRVRPPSDF